MRWAGFGGIERLVAGLLGLIALCAGAPATAVNGTVLWYLEQEAGSEPYRVRYLVTAACLRSDDAWATAGAA